MPRLKEECIEDVQGSTSFGIASAWKRRGQFLRLS
jgi:hypothetical protein